MKNEFICIFNSKICEYFYYLIKDEIYLDNYLDFIFD